MITHPISLILFLLSVEIFVLWFSSQKSFKKYFHFIPPVFWIYFLPMMASTFGLIKPNEDVSRLISVYFLPLSLIFLLLSVDLMAIIRLGRPALLMMAAGSLGIMVGMPLVFGLMKSWVGTEMWSGFGALSASWIGGSANMIAVKEAVSTPEAVFAPMMIVDTIVPYVWMGILIAGAPFQKQFDHYNGSEKGIIEALSQKTTHLRSTLTTSAKAETHDKIIIKTCALILLGIAGSKLAIWCAQALPVVKNIVNPYAWTIILATVLGLGLSLTPAKQLESVGASKVGYFFLYFVLASIGAKASIVHLGSTVVLIVAGFLVVLIHAVFILIMGRILRAPLFLAVAASQANIGGVASAPIIAEVYQPGLACVGLLLAILGNIVGTYLGIITAQLCRIVAG